MPDIPQLIKMLQDKNHDKRYQACEELRVWQQPLPQEAIDALLNATGDSNSDVADAAKRALVLHTQPSKSEETVAAETTKVELPMTNEVITAEKAQKPTQVKTAIYLLYIVSFTNILLNTILRGVNGKYFFPSPDQVVFFIVNMILVFIISKGRSWPRILLLLSYVLALSSSLCILSSIRVEFRYQFIIVSINYLLGLISVILLFLKPAKLWFESFKLSSQG
jgi:hypothetical protein